MRYSMLAVVVISALTVCAPGPAGAQDTGQAAAGTEEAREKVRAACATDAEKLCPGLPHGKGGGLGACLRAHEAELSLPCKAARTERSAIRAKERG